MYVDPGDRPTFVPSACGVRRERDVRRLRVDLRPSARAVRILIVLAGMNGTWALHDATTAPVGESATTQAAAGSTGGRGDPGASETWSPGDDSVAPPTADVGRGSGVGGEVAVPTTTWMAFAQAGGLAGTAGGPAGVAGRTAGVVVGVAVTPAAAAGPAAPSAGSASRPTVAAAAAVRTAARAARPLPTDRG